MAAISSQTDWTIESDVVDERNFARFEFKISFGRISYIAQHPGWLTTQQPSPPAAWQQIVMDGSCIWTTKPENAITGYDPRPPR